MKYVHKHTEKLASTRSSTHTRAHAHCEALCFTMCVCVGRGESSPLSLIKHTHTRETHGRQASDVTVVIETAGASCDWPSAADGGRPCLRCTLDSSSLLCLHHFSLRCSFTLPLPWRISHTNQSDFTHSHFSTITHTRHSNTHSHTHSTCHTERKHTLKSVTSDEFKWLNRWFVFQNTKRVVLSMQSGRNRLYSNIHDNKCSATQNGLFFKCSLKFILQILQMTRV